MLFDHLAHTIKIYDEIAPIYSRRWFDSSNIKPLLRSFSSMLPSNAIVLDAGCGCGRDVFYLTENGHDTVGVDLSMGLLNEARARLPKSYFRLMDIRDLKYPDDLFDGILCSAVINHFVEEDLRLAVESFQRVLRNTGLLCITFKNGDTHEFDSIHRFFQYHGIDDIKRIFAEYGFALLEEKISSDKKGIIWNQLIFQISKSQRESTDGCFFCRENMFPQNVLSKRTIAGSILFGNKQIFAAVDCAPLVPGHLLLISNRHFNSMMQSDIDHNKINDAKHLMRRMSEGAFGRTPLFLEHGTSHELARETSCIDHGHIHSLPLERGLKTRIEEALGPMTNIKYNRRFRSFLSSREYISYEDKAGQNFVKYDNMEQLQSQFFRVVIGEYLNLDEVKWAAVLNEENTNRNFDDTIRRYTEFLDSEQASQPIYSRITETRSHKISSSYSGEFSKRNVAKIQKLKKSYNEELTLREFGEEKITTDILYKVFNDPKTYREYLGDDVASIDCNLGEYERLVATIDPCPRPVIFDFKEEDYRAYGWLSFIISVSDLAASGATPVGVLLNCEMPAEMKISKFLDFLEGVLLASERYDCPVVGGNIKDSDRFACSTAMFGKGDSDRLFTRTGASPGDSLFIVGNAGHFWSAILAEKHKLILSGDDWRSLHKALTYPEPNLWASLELAKTGEITSCMDASDGPTACFKEIASKNQIDFIISRSALLPDMVVEKVAFQLGIDPKVLMLTWGNWELVFTANRERLLYKLNEHPIESEIVWIGESVRGSGIVCYDSLDNRNIIPELSSKRFDERSSFTHGIEKYMEYLLKFGK